MRQTLWSHCLVFLRSHYRVLLRSHCCVFLRSNCRVLFCGLIAVRFSAASLLCVFPWVSLSCFVLQTSRYGSSRYSDPTGGGLYGDRTSYSSARTDRPGSTSSTYSRTSYSGSTGSLDKDGAVDYKKVPTPPIQNTVQARRTRGHVLTTNTPPIHRKSSGCSGVFTLETNRGSSRIEQTNFP